MFDFAALERRVAALEASAPASLRFGRVTGVEGGKCRVQLADGQGVISHPISTLQKRVLKDQDIKMPDLGEPVACLFSGQGCEEGVVLGAYYNGQERDPGKPSAQDYTRYADGTELWYDRENHKLVARVQGDVELETKGKLTATAKGVVTVASAEGITLKAPSITLAGLLTVTDEDGTSGRGTLFGTYEVREGSLHVPDADVTAGAVSLRGHTHTNVESGDGTSGVPVGA